MDRKWFLINAEGMILGRLATKLANIIRGKNKPEFVPYLDRGDFVVVTNAEKVVLTGKKQKQKTHFSHSGYPGGTKFVNYERLLKEKPEKVVMLAVKGMLPKNKLRDKIISKLKVYRGQEHPHSAQRPVMLKGQG